MQIPTKRFLSWNEFKSDFPLYLPRHHDRVSEPVFSSYLFRGQMDADWSLVSSFDRAVPPHVESRDKEFKRWLGFFLSVNERIGNAAAGLSEEENVAMAQHYGVPTRSIDWSLSPYKAAFFCFFDALRHKQPDHRDVAIWAVNLRAFRARSPKGFEFTKVRWGASERVRNQLGRFLENRSDHPSLEAYIAAEDPPLAGALTKFQIPASEARSALNDLLLMGISPVDVYPDFEGVAMYVKLRQLLNGFRF